MTLKIWLTIAVIALAIAYGIWPTAKPVESVQVTQGALVQRVIATGRVAPAARIEVGSLTTANIAQIHVQEGSHVTQGEQLITLYDDALYAALTQAKANLAEAQQRLEEADHLSLPLSESVLTQAVNTRHLAKVEYERQQQLHQKRMTSDSALDQAKKALDNAEAAFISAKLQRDAQTNNGTTRRLLQTRLTQASSALAQAQAKVDQLNLKAPVSGTIMQRNVEIGNTVQPGKVLLVMAADGETRIEVPIDEKSLRHIRTQQSATIIADAYPKQPFSAQLSLLYPSIDASRAIINARFVVPQPPDFLRPDMTVSVDMLINQVQDALILPTDAIHDADSEQPWVMTIVNDKATITPVTLGIQGIGSTQILSGVTTGAWVVTQSNVTPQQRVTPRNRTAPPRNGFDLPAGIK